MVHEQWVGTTFILWGGGGAVYSMGIASSLSSKFIVMFSDTKNN